jgi:hypothetical protein
LAPGRYLAGSCSYEQIGSSAAKRKGLLRDNHRNQTIPKRLEVL